MARRKTLKLRLLAGSALIIASVAATLGIFLWSDPTGALAELAGEPESLVRTQAVTNGDQTLEALRITTTSGLELDLLVLRPDSSEPVPLVLIGLDSQEVLEVARDWTGSNSLAVAFFNCPFQSGALFDLRDSSDGAAARFLVAHRALLAKPWLDRSQVHLVGHDQAAVGAFLAARQLPTLKGTWRFGIFPPAPSGLGKRLAYELAYGGSRTYPGSTAEQPPSQIYPALRWLEERIAVDRGH